MREKYKKVDTEYMIITTYTLNENDDPVFGERGELILGVDILVAKDDPFYEHLVATYPLIEPQPLDKDVYDPGELAKSFEDGTMLSVKSEPVKSK